MATVSKESSQPRDPAPDSTLLHDAPAGERDTQEGFFSENFLFMLPLAMFVLFLAFGAVMCAD